MSIRHCEVRVPIRERFALRGQALPPNYQNQADQLARCGLRTEGRCACGWSVCPRHADEHRAKRHAEVRA